MSFLSKLKSGKLNGVVVDNECNGVSWGAYIDDGIPVQYREGKSSKYFDGEENIRIPGKRTEKRFETNEEKQIFYEKYKWTGKLD